MSRTTTKVITRSFGRWLQTKTERDRTEQKFEGQKGREEEPKILSNCVTSDAYGAKNIWLNDKARLSKDSFIISEKVNSLKHFLSVGEINIGTNVVGKQNKTGAAHF